MVNRWFYIDDRLQIVSVGRLGLKKAKEYEKREARFLFTTDGLDYLREQINEIMIQHAKDVQ